MTQSTKPIHLAAHFPGVNNTTVWSDPAGGSHIQFDSFVHFAQTAERGKFDFLFLAEGLRLREQNGLIYDLDVVGRPDTFTVLAALARSRSISVWLAPSIPPSTSRTKSPVNSPVSII
jgi:alkanesulfonate monooxygenase SsuD/methylene tetrahydromethanopterin reductase-like flavin-dependent oxidoreductase (luciferase family)